MRLTLVEGRGREDMREVRGLSHRRRHGGGMFGCTRGTEMLSVDALKVTCEVEAPCTRLFRNSWLMCCSAAAQTPY